MHITCQGQQFLLPYHLDGFFSGGRCGFFKIEFTANRDDENVVFTAFSFCNQCFVYMINLFVQQGRNLFPCQRWIGFVIMTSVLYFFTVKKTHDICFISLFHNLTCICMKFYDEIQIIWIPR